MNLPLDCESKYINNFLSSGEANALYNLLISDYEIDKSRIIINAGGKTIKTDSFKILFVTKRLLEQNTHPEEIHGKSFVWSGIMQELRAKVEDFTSKEFELAMCLFYPDGHYFAPYHSDQQTSGLETILPSISIGAVREFSFKHKRTDELYNLDLADGSLLLMGKHCQDRYLHSLIQNDNYKDGRINITFREPEFK